MPKFKAQSRAGLGISLFIVLCGRTVLGGPDAGSGPADRPPLSDSDAAAARKLMETWASAQSNLVWKEYAALYAPAFQGIRRSGTRTVTLDRKRWLAERARMFEQGGMSVDVNNPVYESDGADGIRVRFEQTWSAGAYADRGNKVIVLQRDGGGHLKIVREELLDSQIDHTPIVAEKSEDFSLLKIIYPNNAKKTKAPDASWTFTKRFEDTAAGTALGDVTVVLWNESGNPFRHTQFESENLGGVAVIRDGRVIGARYGLESAPTTASLIKVDDGLVLAVRESAAMRGDFFEVLEVYMLTKTGLRLKGSVPVQMNDEGGENSYSCEATVDIRDVDGNGIPDIVVTPTHLRRPKSCEGFPRVEKRWLF